jgi:acylphosphatase
MADQASLSAVVHGMVQGVGFRWAVQQRALELSVTGYVSNRFDGTVEVVAEGAPADLAELEKFLHSGPRWAEVSRVDIERGAATGRFSRFVTK